MKNIPTKSLWEKKKTYRKTRARLLIKLIVKLGRNFSSKRTEKLERDFSSKLVDRRNHGETTGMLALIPSLLLWSAFPLCSGGRYRRSAEWGLTWSPGPIVHQEGTLSAARGGTTSALWKFLGLCVTVIRSASGPPKIAVQTMTSRVWESHLSPKVYS